MRASDLADRLRRRRSARRLPLVLLAISLPVAGLRAQRDDDAGTGGQFSLPRSQDDVAEFKEAGDDLKAHRFEDGVERLLHLWRSVNTGVIARVGAVDRWDGMRMRVISTLRDLDADGRAACERLATRELGPLANAPLGSLGTDDLLWIARSFPTTARGMAARLRLGDLALEQGDALTAQQHFLAADDAMRADDPLRVALAARRETANLMVRAGFDPLDTDSPLAAPIEGAMTSAGDVGWPAYGGGFDGARPMQEPTGSPKNPYHVPLLVDGFDLNPFAMHAVGDVSAVYVNDGQAVHAIDPVGRRVLWDGRGEMVGRNDVGAYREGINSDMVLACAVGSDVVVAALQVPNDVVGADQTRQYQNAMTIMQRIPSRRLYAFERSTGKLLWAHWDQKDGIVSRRFTGHDACGAPVISGDTVYAPVHDPTGAISYSIAAYDLRTGAPRWRRLVCASQQEVNMFGNSQQEFAAGPIAVHEGVVYGTTNLGVVFAADAEDGELRWLTAYDTIPLPAPQFAQAADRRPVFFANNPLVITNGVLATTPIDSQFALGFDTKTGDPQWRMSFNAYEDVSVRWLLGALDGEFVFSGQGVVAVAPRAKSGAGRTTRADVRLIASKDAVGEGYYRSTAIPRGALSHDRLWLIGSDSVLRILDGRGNRDTGIGDLAQLGRGNVLMVDGLLALTSDSGITTWADPDSLLRSARKRVEQRPGDPQIILRLARLERARLGDAMRASDADRVEQVFLNGLAAADARGLGRGSRVRSELAEGLFQIAFDRAMNELQSDPAAAKQRLIRARDIAQDAGSWLRAQQEILALCPDARERRAELDAMTQRWPEASFTFRDVGRARVATWAAIARIPVTEDPRAAVRICHDLVERSGEESIGNRRVRDVAIDALRALVEHHGEGVLADLEGEAKVALEQAGDDVSAIRAVAARFPLTPSARRATSRLLDDAVTKGDLEVVARTCAAAAASGELGPSMLRRLIAVASARGNAGLAAGLARRVVATSGDLVSDFTADGGRRLRDVLAEVAPPPMRGVPPLQIPAAVLGTLVTPNPQAKWSMQRVQRVPGFTGDQPLPLLANIGEQQLFVFELDPPPTGISDARFTIPINGGIGQPSLDPVLQCGDVLVVCDLLRLSGVDRSTGRNLWTLGPRKDRWMRVLGSVDGVLAVQVAASETQSDDAAVLAVEPLSGSVLAQIDVGRQVPGGRPVLSGDLCWLLETEGPDGVVARAFDVLTGQEVEHTPIDSRLLDSLGLLGPQSHRLQSLRSEIFADATTLYLPVETNQVDEPSRVVALQRGTGTVKWRWTGTPGCLLNRYGKQGDRVVVFERSALVARLVVLDERGAEAARFDQASLASVQNWPDDPFAGVPDPVILTDNDSGMRLTCVSIKPGGPRFQLDLSTVQTVRGVLCGPTFLTILSQPRGQSAPMIQAMDLATRRTILPGGRSTLDIRLTRPVDIFALEGRVIVQTIDTLRILGTPR